MSSYGDMTGRTVFITGGSQGLGKGFARAFAKAGANVCIVSRTEEKLRKVQKELTDEFGIRCIWHVADIMDRAAIEAARDKAVEAFGGIDFLINNAAANAQQIPLEDISMEDFRKVVDTNVLGTLNVSQALFPLMKKQGHGVIINMCSIGGQVFHGYFIPGAYEVSKDGLTALTKAMAFNWSPYGIRVNAIRPGYFLSDCNQEFCENNPGMKEKLADQVPLKRWGMPDEIGPLAVFLCSDEAGYLLGEIVTVDGGRTFR